MREAFIFFLQIKWDNLCIALRATGAFDDSSKCVDGSDDVWRLDIAHLRGHISACHRVFQHYEQIHTWYALFTALLSQRSSLV